MKGHAMLRVSLMVDVNLETYASLTEADLQFFFEEHVCLDDILELHVMPEIDEATKAGSCTCYRGKIELVRTADEAFTPLELQVQLLPELKL